MSRRRGDAWKHRPFHRAFARLSAAARAEVIAGFRTNAPTTRIVELVEKTHGEQIPISSLNRYREWWNTTERPVLEAAMKAEELLKAFREHPTAELESLISQLLQAQRLAAMAEDKAPDPIELGHLDVKERRLRLQERALALRERELETRVKRTAGKVGEKLKRAQVDEATIETIRTEIYGLAPRKVAS